MTSLVAFFCPASAKMDRSASGGGRFFTGSCETHTRGTVEGWQNLLNLYPLWAVPLGQARIQDSEGGVSYIQKGGGSYRNFRSGSKLLQGPGQINKQKKIADSRRGGFR